jgi:hypothetical protein
MNSETQRNHAQYFGELEGQMHEMRAMVEIVQLLTGDWINRRQLSRGVEWESMLAIATKNLELMVEGMVDDYRSKLNGRIGA